MLARSGHEPRPSMPVGRQAPASKTLEDRTNVTISTDLAAVTRNGDVACVQRGAWRKRWCSNVSSVTWRFVWTDFIFLRIITQKKLIRHLFVRLVCKQLKPRPKCKSKDKDLDKFFLETYLLHYAIRSLQHFKGILSNFCFLPNKMIFVSQTYPA